MAALASEQDAVAVSRYQVIFTKDRTTGDLKETYNQETQTLTIRSGTITTWTFYCGGTAPKITLALVI